jgi:hypothetical protein
MLGGEISQGDTVTFRYDAGAGTTFSKESASTNGASAGHSEAEESEAHSDSRTGTRRATDTKKR